MQIILKGLAMREGEAIELGAKVFARERSRDGEFDFIGSGAFVFGRAQRTRGLNRSGRESAH